MIDLILYIKTIPWVLLGVFFFLITLLIFISEYCYLRKILKPNTSRKIIHSLVGLAVSLSPFIFISNTQPLILAAIFLMINLFSYKNNKLKSFHDLNRETLGTIFFPLSFILIAIFFWEYKNIMACSFLILAFSDPLSSFIGENLKKKHRYNIEVDSKSYEGSTVMFLSTFIILILFSNSIFYNLNSFDTLFAILLCSISITLAEAISIKGSDNLTIPIIAFFFIEMLNTINEKYLMIEFLIITAGITILLFYFYKKNHLSLSGFFSSSLMAILILGFGGLKYVLPIAMFFILSTFLSKIGPKNLQKSKTGRTTYQVLANGGVGLILCIINNFYHEELFFYMFLASIAAANSDTWATEIGKLSKTKPKDIISGRILMHGESGGITSVGLIGSIAGSAIIAMLGFFLKFNFTFIVLVFISGFLGSLFDSILGSTLQGRFISYDGKTITESKSKNKYLYSGLTVIDNNTVNLVCTISAVIVFNLILIFI